MHNDKVTLKYELLIATFVVYDAQSWKNMYVLIIHHRVENVNLFQLLFSPW